nr:hypothetical protein CFP56_20273 [Quercus suber]
MATVHSVGTEHCCCPHRYMSYCSSFPPMTTQHGCKAMFAGSDVASFYGSEHCRRRSATPPANHINHSVCIDQRRKSKPPVDLTVLVAAGGFEMYLVDVEVGKHVVCDLPCGTSTKARDDGHPYHRCSPLS